MCWAKQLPAVATRESAMSHFLRYQSEIPVAGLSPTTCFQKALAGCCL